MAVLSQPRSEHSGVMVACIVDDKDHPAARPTTTCKLTQEEVEGGSIERGFPARSEPAVCHGHGAEGRDALARGRMQELRVLFLGRHPHDTA